MKFLKEGLEHASGGDVRQASEEVIIKLYRNVGSPVKDFLPPDGDKTRRNVLYKQLFVAFDEIDGKQGNKTDRVCWLIIILIIILINIILLCFETRQAECVY